MKTSRLWIIGAAIVLIGVWWYLRPKDQHQMDQSSLSPEPFAQKKSAAGKDQVHQKNTPRQMNVASAGASPALPAPRNVAQVGDKDSLEQFLKKLDGKAEWRVNKTDSGRVTAISGALIAGHSDSPEKLQEFAQQISEVTGVPGHQIVPSKTLLQDTPETEARQFDQEVDGYKVFAGYMKIFTRKSDGAIYYIANETRDVGQVDLRIKYTGPEAAQIAVAAYAEKIGVVAESVSPKPVIYPDQASGNGELAWEVVLRIERPLFDRRHLLISAISGQILKDVTLVVH